MPIRRGMGGLSSGAGGNLFDRPGFFDNAEVVNLTVDTKLLLKAASETYGVEITHSEQTGNYVLDIPTLSANAEVVTTTAVQTLTNKTIAGLVIEALQDSNNNEILGLDKVASAVNYIQITNSATGNPVMVKAAGDDTNVDIRFVPKGSGKVVITSDVDIQGTSTTVNSTTLDVDDKNITMGSVASPSDTTADGGGITLKGATDKTIIWDNTNDNWTSSEHFNLAAGKDFKVDNVVLFSGTSLGAGIVTSSLTATGALNSGSITSGFGAIDTGASAITTTGTITGGQLDIDNIRINGNTVSSTSGELILDSVSTLNFSDDAIINIGSLAIDSIVGDNNAIQIGDNSDDAVSIYRINALTAIGNIDIGGHDLRAYTITPDGLSAGQVVYTGTSGVLSAESGFEYNASSNTLTVNTITPTNINAFTLGGKLTAGSNEIEGSNFDITGGTVAGVTATSLTVNSGTVGGGLTWSAAQSFGDVALTGVNIDGGTINGITSIGIKQSATGYEAQFTVGSTSLTAHRAITIDPNDAARTLEISGDLTFGNAFITGSHALTLTTTSTTNVTFPTTGTLSTLAGNETLTNKDLTTPTIGDFTNATHAHSNNASGGVVPIANTSGTLAIARGGTGATSLANLITLSTHTTGDYVATITAGTGLTSNGATSGEGTIHSLSVDASQTQITSVGALNVGSITSGFTSIDVGSGAISTTGTATTGALVIGGDISTAAAQDWDLVDNTASALSFDASGKTGILEIDTRNGAERVTMSGGLVVTGDLTVSGTTTTVNSTTVTVDDPIFTVGGDSAPSSDDNKDRGISFRWHNGSAAKEGFFGYDDSTGKFTFIPDASFSSEVTSGTAGTIVATTFEGALTGNADTATTATTATNITAVANNSTDETTYITFVDGATGGQGIETDTGLTYNPSTGALTAGSFVGTIAGGSVADDAITNAKLANMAANTIKVRNANSTGDPSDLAVADTQIVIGDGTGFTVAALSGDVTMANTGAVTIANNAVQAAMVHEDVISSRTELTSGNVATSSDFLLLWDATDSTYKKVKPANLGVSGLASGSANEIQYNNSNAFAGASNVEIKNNSLALKEQSTPNATSGFGMVYAKTDNELYYRNDTNSEVQITSGGAIAGGGAFRGVKANLSANNGISNNSATTPTAWSEVYDVGTFHDGSTNPERFTFGGTGYFLISIQQEWEADSAGYRQMDAVYRDTSASSNTVLVRDRIEGSNQSTNVSGASTTVYVNDSADYITIQLYQNSGASLNAIAAGTVVSIIRLDMATQASATSSGTVGHIQLSDGSGGFTHDGSAIIWDSTNNRLGVNTASPSYSIDTTASGTVRAATFTGALAGNATTATTLATARTIGGTSFDGSANISVALADTATALATARTIGGTSFDGSANIAVALASTATALATARTIGGVSFDGTANISLPGVNATGNQNTSGSAATLTTARTIGGTSFDGSANIAVALASAATTLETARTIGGVSFDGSANISLPGVNASGNQDTTGTAASWTTARTLSFTGDVTGTGSVDGSANVATALTIAATSVEGSMLNTNVISGQTALTSGLASTDELFVSDAGTLKRMDVAVLSTYQAALSETLTNKTLTTPTIGSFANAGHTHADAAGGGQITLGTGTTGNYVATVAGDTNEIVVSASTGAVSIGIADNPTLPGNVTVSGNLTVSGSTTTVDTATLTVEDPLVSLATGNNSSDAVDIGIYGLYDTSGSQDLYGGLFRDASDSGKWKLFKDLQAAPTTTVNTSGTGYAVGTLVANIEGSATTVTQAAQGAIESLGTLTVLQVDNLNINLNTISATTGAINITPAAGSAIVLDGTISVDAGLVTGATSITSTNFVGAIDGIVGGTTPAAITGTTITANTSFTRGDTVITDGVITDSTGLSIAAAVDLGANTLTSTGSMQIRTIDYSDGTLAQTIASDGKVTFAQEATFSGGFDVGSDAAGDILYHNGTSYVRLAKGNADQVLTMNDAANAPGWEDAGGGGGANVARAMAMVFTV